MAFITKRLTLLFSFCLAITMSSCAQPKVIAEKKVVTGADRTEVYFPLLKGKKVGVFANQTSMIGNTHLVDSLLSSGIKVVKIFGPEHGFRGTADAGAHVKDGVDSKTGLPIISLYGTHKKPTTADLADIDVLVFDIQDVGVRFYTYISSLEYVLEACFENHKPIMLLDRPNPNGFYVDGPVLQKSYSSFVGLQPIPIVYGMTIGEYGMMLAGENWLSAKANAINNYNITTKPTADTPFHFLVIKCKEYDHNTKYQLPIAPSPNLREMQSVYWYPSIAFFEGTVISEGRGTDKPFQIFGHPKLPKNLFSFVPNPNEGAKNSKLYGERCYGYNLAAPLKETMLQVNGQIHLQYLIDVYKMYPDKKNFFLTNNFIDKLAGSNALQTQIKKGLSEAEIKKTWAKDLNAFKKIRIKYLLYDDFIQ